MCRAYMAREGEQAAAAWKSVNLKPFIASLSMLGVRISPPKQDKSLKPRSSATMTRKFGRFLVPSEEAMMGNCVYSEDTRLKARRGRKITPGMRRTTNIRTQPEV